MPKKRKKQAPRGLQYASRLKGNLFRTIKENSESAARLRLVGRIEGAMSHERTVNNAMRVAERKGWGDAACRAEETGVARAMANPRKGMNQYGF